MYRLLIINYHEMIHASDISKDSYPASVSELVSQLEAVTCSSWRMITRGELEDPASLFGNMLLITFDDKLISWPEG